MIKMLKGKREYMLIGVYTSVRGARGGGEFIDSAKAYSWIALTGKHQWGPAPIEIDHGQTDHLQRQRCRLLVVHPVGMYLRVRPSIPKHPRLSRSCLRQIVLVSCLVGLPTHTHTKEKTG